MASTWPSYAIPAGFQVLSSKGSHRITYISTPENIQSLQNLLSTSSTILTTSTTPNSHINMVEIPLPHVDGLPEAAESTADLPIHKIPYLKRAYDRLQLPLSQILRDSDINWIVHDFVCNWLPGLATQLGINSVFFSIYNATTLAFLGPPSELISGRRNRPEDYTVVPDWIDFPSNVAFKLHEMVSHWDCMTPMFPIFKGWVRRDSNFVTTRSCPEYEADSLSLLRNLYGKPVVPVGLLPPPPIPISIPIEENEAPQGDERWGRLRRWLHDKEEKSVVYIALGTEVSLGLDSMHELAYGIEKSRLPFIWVVNNRKLVEGIMGPDIIPSGFENRVSGRGFIWRGWAPQLKILAHSSVGGFLTHCGWSSVIEALGFGRALVLFSGANSDQGLIARQLQDKGVGLEVPRDEDDGSFTNDSVARTMRLVMVEKEGEPIRAKAWAMREVFGNADLQNKHLDEFTQFLEKNSIGIVGSF